MASLRASLAELGNGLPASARQILTAAWVLADQGEDPVPTRVAREAGVTEEEVLAVFERLHEAASRNDLQSYLT